MMRQGSEISRREFLMAAGAAGIAIPVVASIDGIQIGVCAPPRDLDQAVRYGFDYLEPPAAGISAMDTAAFETFKNKVLASPIRCECYNSLIRGHSLRVVGDEVHWEGLHAYLEHTLGRCRQLGGTIAVWGSSRSRNVPPGYSREKAWGQIRDFLRRTGDVARNHHMIIAIEPLRHEESNILNTGAEALRMVHEVNHPNIKMIIDYFHLREEKESPDILWKARKEIVHFHFANPHGRVWPKSPSEDPGYGEFFKLVRKIRYHGGISIEARGTFARDATGSLAFFRREITSA